ncbi:MAG: peptidylprolyl isomerase [Phycisphaerae bacterium]
MIPGRPASYVLILFSAAASSGCKHADRARPATVGSAFERRAYTERTPPGDDRPNENVTPAIPLEDRERTGYAQADVIATVNAQPITRRQLVDILMRSHGADLLEQLAALEAARALAELKKLSVGAKEFNREYERTLRRLVDPLSSVALGSFDREQGERLLDTVLAERHMSRDEYLVIVRRNAYLRAIVESQQVLTEQQLRDEYERAYGTHVQIRHIQLASPGEANRALDSLKAGADFAELAERISANAASARTGGLLAPFSQGDDDIPELFRKVAFSLAPGQVSDPVRIGSWYHLLKLEKRIPAESPGFALVRAELEQRARERLSWPAMERLYQRLLRDTVIEIHDPVLRDAFDKKNFARGSAE